LLTGGAAWSPEGGRIAYVSEELFISDTSGGILDSLGGWKRGVDWGPLDSNSIVLEMLPVHRATIIYLDTHEEDTLGFFSGSGFKWSPNGEYLIGHDEKGWYVININGTNKWDLEP
jgi:hypothetical protein